MFEYLVFDEHVGIAYHREARIEVAGDDLRYRIDGFGPEMLDSGSTAGTLKPFSADLQDSVCRSGRMSTSVIALTATTGVCGIRRSASHAGRSPDPMTDPTVTGLSPTCCFPYQRILD